MRDVVDESNPTAQRNLRLLALAAIYDGAARTKTANIRGFGLQIIRNWVLRFAFAAAVLTRWNAPATERLNRSESGATSHTAIARCARLFDTRGRQSAMLATLLIIVASIVAGMIVSHVHPEYRKS